MLDDALKRYLDGYLEHIFKVGFQQFICTCKNSKIREVLPHFLCYTIP